MKTISQGVVMIALDNGLNIIFKSSSAPVFYATLSIDAGPMYENEENNGISHFLEHLCFKEGRHRIKRKRRIYKINRLGGDIDGETEYRFTTFALETLLENWYFHLITFLDLIACPYFSNKDVENERALIINELKDDETAEELFNLIGMKRLFPNHPLSLPLAGTKNIVSSLTSGKIREWHKRFYQPNRMILTVIGDIKLKNLLKIVKMSKLYNLPNATEIIAEPPRIDMDFNASVEIEGCDINMSQIIFPMPANDNYKDIFLVYLISNYIINDNSTCPLSLRYNIERKAGLYGGIESDVYLYRSCNFISITLQAYSHKQLKGLESRFFNWLERVIKKGLTNDVFQRLYHLRQLALAKKIVSTPEGYMEFLITAIKEDSLEHLDIYESMHFIQKTDIESVFRKYFSDRKIIFRSLKRKA